MNTRTEFDFATGEARAVHTCAYVVDGAAVLIDEGQPVPAGAVLASSVPAAPAVPQAVTMKQAQLALLAAGKLDAVDGLIAAQARAVRVVWATSPTVERSNPLVASIGTSLGLTDAQIDALFEQAAKL
jgi:hypothetical protein